MAVRMKIEGDKNLIRRFKKLVDKDIKKINSKAAAKAVIPIRKELKRRAKTLPLQGDAAARLSKAIGTKTKSYQRGHVKVKILGARKGETVRGLHGNNKPMTWDQLMFWWEFGTKNIPAGKFSIYRGGLNATTKQSVSAYRKQASQGLNALGTR